jgi:sec-independent protein translocase protein TatA
VPSIGTTELLILAVILLVLFGGKKLPEFARGVGDSIREFKKAAKE